MSSNVQLASQGGALMRSNIIFSLKQSTTAIALATTMALPSMVNAQDMSDQVIEEIVVTSTKRETTLQDTPVAVSVISGRAIDRANIADIKDLGSIVPSLRVNQLQNSVNTNFIIRGFGNGANNAGIEPSVGVFIDGVYRSRSAARMGDLPKLERVEVLRGPQSTLFGKNASAGVVSVVTAKPSYEKEGYIDIGYGNHDSLTGKLYYTNAISETAAFSIGGSIHKRDGYVETLPGIDPLNDRNRWNVRGQFLFEPSDKTTIRFIGDYSSLDENCCAVTHIQTQGAAGAIFALGGLTSDADDPFARQAFQNKNSENTVDDYGFSMHVTHDFENSTLTSITSKRSTESFQNTDVDFNSLAMLDFTQDLIDISTFTQEIRLESNNDGKFHWMLGGFFFSEDVSQDSELAYGDDLRSYMDVLVGGASVLGGIEALYGHAPGTFFNGDVGMQEAFTQDNNSHSLFGTVDFEITDRFTITGGLNYTKDKKTITGNTTNNDVFSNIDLTNDLTLLGLPFPTVVALGEIGRVNAGAASATFNAAFTGATGFPASAATIAAVEAGAPGTTAAIANAIGAGTVTALEPLQFQPQFLGFPNAIEDGLSNDDKVTWNLRASFEATDDLNFYASASTGYKSTSWNLSRDSRPFLVDAVALDAAGLLPTNYKVASGRNFSSRLAGPENSKVYELGMKARFDRGSLHVSIFDQTIKGFQSNTFLGTGFGLANAGEQSTQGLEVDAKFSPVPALTFGFSGIFLDPIYDSFEGGIDGINSLTGTKPSGIPSTALSVSANYDHEFENGTNGFIRADWQYESEVQTNEGIEVTIGAAQPFRTISTFNTSAGIILENGLQLQIFARNLFDDTYLTTTFPGVAQAGVINGYLNQPRMFGANLRKSF
jgi:outer membrane receptor protein involved in Fe transport